MFQVSRPNDDPVFFFFFFCCRAYCMSPLLHRCVLVLFAVSFIADAARWCDFYLSSAAEPVMKVTEAQLDAARVDPAWRDYCSHLLIPLNKCRRANSFLPWKCVDERHTYEKCQYDQYVLGVMHLFGCLVRAGRG